MNINVINIIRTVFKNVKYGYNILRCRKLLLKIPIKNQLMTTTYQCSCEIILGHNENINLGVIPLVDRKNYRTVRAMILTSLLAYDIVSLVVLDLSKDRSVFGVEFQMKAL
jgi:hypothetical protein